MHFASSRSLKVGLSLVVLVGAACGSSSKKASSATSSPATAGASSSGLSSGNQASAPGVTTNTVKIGFITDVTGSASSTWSQSALGAKARFNALNSQGGVNGRKVDLITADGTSTPSGNATAVNFLISQGAFGVIDDSSFAFGGAPAARRGNVPVTGPGIDGTEWGTQPNTNMFATLGGQNPTHPELQADIPAVALFKFLGVKNVGGLAYGISPSSIASIKDTNLAAGDAPQGDGRKRRQALSSVEWRSRNHPNRGEESAVLWKSAHRDGSQKSALKRHITAPYL
jgi:hypothetical protein